MKNSTDFKWRLFTALTLITAFAYYISYSRHATLHQQQPATTQQRPVQNDNSFLKQSYMETLPSSSIWCTGNSRGSRICRFKNLYIDTQKDSFIFVFAADSLIVGLPEDADWAALIDLTTLEEHNAFYFKLTQVSAATYQKRNMHSATATTHVFSRFHCGNIMHTLHDDFLGAYHTQKQFLPGGDQSFYILFSDEHGDGPYTEPFKLLTKNPLQFKRLLPENSLIHLPDALVGNSKLTSWYHYGFQVPQGPIEGKVVDGRHVRSATDFIAETLGLPAFSSILARLTLVKRLVNGKKRTEEDSFTAVAKTDSPLIVIISRLSDRLILNEQQLALALSARFSLPVSFLRNEDHSFTEQIALMRRAVIAVGMHGSLLVMGMFMMPGSLLVELYPYAVPAENYTPYREMCRLKGLYLAYEPWTNRHPDKNVSFPERPSHHGGIVHLPKEEQKQIESTKTVPLHLCCTNPYWLYRIFQDTTVSIPEVIETIEKGLDSALTQITHASEAVISVAPAIINKMSCLFDRNQSSVHLSWEAPWNCGDDCRLRYSVWSHTHYREFVTSACSIKLDSCDSSAEQHDFWIRTVDEHGKQSAYSKKLVCK